MQPESKVTPSSLDAYVPDYIASVLDNPERWTPAMKLPEAYPRYRVEWYQSLIDRVLGTSAGQPIVKLVWMPEVLEWWPHPLGMDPPGYVYPSWEALVDSHGQKVAAPRWGLMQRMEPEQYLPGWNTSRWPRLHGTIYDAKGPPPTNGLYTRLKRHILHKDSCCLRAGNEENCWGYYLEPNEELLQWIGMQFQASYYDPEVDPHTPVEHLDRRQTNLIEKDRLEKEKIVEPEGVEIPTVTPAIFSGHFVKRGDLYLPGE